MVYRTAYKYDMQQIVHLMPELNSTSWTNKFVSHRRSTVCMHLHAARSLARSLARHGRPSTLEEARFCQRMILQKRTCMVKVIRHSGTAHVNELVQDLLRNWAISYVANICGCLLIDAAWYEEHFQQSVETVSSLNK